MLIRRVAGIGPAYTDKVARIGIRFHDLLHESVLRDKLAVVLRRHNTIFTHVYNQPPFDRRTNASSNV